MSKGIDSSTKSRLAMLAATLQGNYAVILVALGSMLALFPFNWGLDVTSSQTMLERPFESNAIVDIGEAIGYLAAMAVGLRGRKHLQSTALLAMPFALVALGSCLIALCEARPQLALALAGDALMGCGYALTFVMWLDLASKLLPKKMLIVIALGYFFNFVTYPIIVEVGTGVGLAYVLGCVVLSGFLWFVGRATLRPSSPIDDAPVRSTAYLPPSRLIAFAAIIPFAYGFCTSYLNIWVSSVGLKIGFALPAVMIIVGLLLFYDRFNLSTVYWITCPLMIVGLLSSFFLDLPPMLSKALITAALASVHFVTYMIVRVQSQERGRSPLFAYALTSALMMVATKTAKELEFLFAGKSWEPYVIACLIVAVVLSYGLLVIGQKGNRPFDIRTMLSDETERDYATRLAQDFGLSKRETSVYALVLDDLTIAEIAEELFIAPSTVRAHISLIYEKFDVHTRQELLRKTRS